MNTRDMLAGAGVGAALAFLFDPNRGNARLALARDKIRRASRMTREGLDATARDMGNRARGIAAATRGRLSRSRVGDRTLVERVRAVLGRLCSHPRAIDVFARDGEITLRGPILSGEVTGLLSAVASVRGVSDVHNEMEAHETAEGVPSLQGDGRVGAPVPDIMQHRWAPATRALVGAGAIATGMGLLTYARRRAGDGGIAPR
jgi:gas vesicle protein